MHRTAVRWLVALGFGLGPAVPAFSQPGIATLSHVDGVVTRAGAAAATGASLIDGERIETAAGRAEITFEDGTAVYLDRHAHIIVNSNERIQVLDGRVSVRAGGAKPYLADTPAAKLIMQAGSIVEVTVNAGMRDALFRVITGVARVDGGWGAKQVPDYYTAYVSAAGNAPVLTRVVSAPSGEFERWALARTVMATSTVLKGGDVAYAPWYDAYYTSPGYTQYPQYLGSTYATSYYAGTYSSTPSYYYPSYYSYAAPYSYYNSYARYPDARYPYSSHRDSNSRRTDDGHRRDVARQLPASHRAAPARGASRGARIPRP